MIRYLAVYVAVMWMVGCQCQPRTPVYDPFAAAAQRVAPPATGALNQSSGYYQAPAYQQPAYPPAQSYPPPAAYQAPSISVPQVPQPQVPPGFVPVPSTSSAPARLTPVSRVAGSTAGGLAGGRSVPTPTPTADWPPRRRLQMSDDLSWNSPSVPGGIRQASADLPMQSSGTPANDQRYPSRLSSLPAQRSSVQPTTYWAPDCLDCDPYNTPHIANPLLPMPLVYEEAYPYRSTVAYSANQSYANDQWRRRPNR
jgi:hypothetical protein